MKVPRLLRENLGFRHFWCSQTVSMAGDNVTLLALPLVAVLALGAGPAEMGLLTAAGWAPNLCSRCTRARGSTGAGAYARR